MKSRKQRRVEREQSELMSTASTYEGEVLVVSEGSLKPLSSRPSLPAYIRQLWNRRFFIAAEARSKALRSTRDLRMWQVWLILNPLFDVALYGFLFGFLFKTSHGVDNFVGYLFLGVIFMRILTGVMSAGNGLIASSRAIIRSFLFPRASLVLSRALRSMIDNLLPAIVALIAAFAMQWGTWPRWTLIIVIPLYVMIHIFACGLMFILARLTLEIPEVKSLVGLFTRAWFFLSGVMFSIDRFDHYPTIHAFMEQNPAYLFLMAIRDASIYGTVPSWQVWLTLFAWTIGTFAVGFIYFWHAEEKYVRLA